jgi:biopolymer transport protein ExbB/TolQ
MAKHRAALSERAVKLIILVILALIAQTFYTIYVRPKAEEWIAQERSNARTIPGYTPKRSIWVIIQDPEQEATITVSIWAMILAAMRFREISAQRRWLSADLINVPPGHVILQRDAREYQRKLDELPPEHAVAVVPRVLRQCLKRFGETGNVQDASQTVHNVCESEYARLDAELSILRFSVWVTPALGFVGTVRGIGLSLQGAEQAMQGDTTAVTEFLGISFNSTLVALILSIVLMFILHEIQLMQERLALDAEVYAEDQLVSKLRKA